MDPHTPSKYSPQDLWEPRGYSILRSEYFVQGRMNVGVSNPPYGVPFFWSLSAITTCLVTDCFHLSQPHQLLSHQTAISSTHIGLHVDRVRNYKSRSRLGRPLGLAVLHFPHTYYCNRVIRLHGLLHFSFPFFLFPPTLT